MRTNGSRVIACAMALAMATSMTFPVGAFAEIGELDPLQREQVDKAAEGGFGVVDGADVGEDGDSAVASNPAGGGLD